MRSTAVRAAIITAATGLLALVVVLAVDAVVPGFFRRDDAVNEFLPYLSEISRLVTSGQLPILTSHSINGGNLLIDFQRSMFHPVVLVAALAYPLIANPSMVALLVAVVALWGVFLAGYTTGAVFGAGRLLRWFLAITLGFSPLFFALYLTAWWNASLSASAVLWLLAALEWYTRTRTPKAAILVGLAVMNQMLLGWPHGYIAMAFLFTAYAVRLWVAARASGSRTVRELLLAPLPLLLAAVIPVLVALPLLSEFLTQGDNTSRTRRILNDDFATPSLSQVLNVVNPSGGDLWNIYGGFRWWPLPIGYISLALLLLVFVRNWRELFRRADLVVLISLGGAFLFLSQMPSEFGPLRSTFRMLPYGGAFLAVATTVLLARAAFTFTRRRALVASGVIVLAAVYASWRVAVPLADLRYSVVMPVTAAVVGVVGLVVVLRTRRVAAAALALTSIGAVLMGLQIPRGLSDTYLGSSSYPDFFGAQAGLAEIPEEGFILHTSSYYTFGNAVVPEFAAARYLLADKRVVNGYDPVGFRAYTDKLAPIAVQGHLPLDAVDALAVPSRLDPSVCDLTVWGVRTVVTVTDPDATRAPVLEACGFEPVRREREDTLWVDRSRPMTGTASWSSPGLVVSDDVERSDIREVLTVANESGEPGTVVFARMAWPGYSASAAGSALEVGAYDGVLVSVTVPAGYVGDVELSYFPRSWRWALPVSACALLAGVLVGLVSLRRARISTKKQEGSRE